MPGLSFFTSMFDVRCFMFDVIFFLPLLPLRPRHGVAVRSEAGSAVNNVF
jgi:hypothetical protein